MSVRRVIRSARALIHVNILKLLCFLCIIGYMVYSLAKRKCIVLLVCLQGDSKTFFYIMAKNRLQCILMRLHYFNPIEIDLSLRCTKGYLLFNMFAWPLSFIYEDRQKCSVLVQYASYICWKCVLSCGMCF